MLCQSFPASLNKACIDECEDIAELLVGYGADIDAEDRELWTPLHASAACENFAMVQYLVENGANVAAINADGNLPADLVEEDEELRKYLHVEMNKHGRFLLPLNSGKSTQGSPPPPPPGREDSHLKRQGILVIWLRSKYQGICSPLGCWWQNTTILSCQSSF